jgi:hypothetical protein
VTYAQRHGTIHGSSFIGGGTYLDLRDLNGNEILLGYDGYAQDFVIGTEILRVEDDAVKGLGTYKYCLPRQHMTGNQNWNVGDGFVVWPTVNGSLTPTPKSGTIYGAISGADMATMKVLNIDTDKYGTVWRWF